MSIGLLFMHANPKQKHRNKIAMGQWAIYDTKITGHKIKISRLTKTKYGWTAVEHLT